MFDIPNLETALKAYNSGNLVRARELLKKLAKPGQLEPIIRLAHMCSTGEGGLQDEAEAFRLFCLAADQGDSSAQFSVGLRYHQGRGVTRNIGKAAYWYRKSSDQDFGPAQLNLASILLSGDGAAIDRAEAINWLERSALSGVVSAQFTLGEQYELGTHVERNDEQAAEWFTQAANRGHAKSQTRLGLAYHTGKGVEKDDELALKWFTLAAEQGEALAQFSLAYMYRNGLGTPPDAAAAAAWYQKAANQSFTPAQYNLGFLYRKGLGVPRDHTQARLWYGRAAATGDVQAGVALEAMDSPMLFNLLDAIDALDKSVLVEVTEMPRDVAVKAGLITVVGSANYRLWTELSKLGWMTKEDHLSLVGGKALPGVEAVQFRVLAAGYDRLSILLGMV